MPEDSVEAPVSEETVPAKAPSLAQRIANSLAAPATPPTSDGNAEILAAMKAQEKRIKDLQRTISKMGEENKELKGGQKEVDGSKQFTDPVGWERDLRESLKAEFEAELAPVRNQNTWTRIAASNPLAAELMSDVETLAWLEEQAKDPEALKSYGNSNDVMLESALFKAAGRKFAAQGVARKAPPTPRPESGGAANPPDGGVILPSKDTMEDKAASGKATWEEAASVFLKKAAKAGFK